MPRSPFPHKTKYLTVLILQAVLYFLLLETSCRLFWVIKHGGPFLSDHGILYAFYPQIKKLEKLDLSPDSDTLDILMIDGSVLHRDFSSTEKILLERLAYETKRRVRVHNVSEPAHTSRDSYYKYKYLADRHFDLVILYDGINDVRANNAPPDIFQKDYSHFSRYKLINAYDRNREIVRYVTFPYTLYYGYVHALEHLRSGTFAPRHKPNPEWVQYGASLKTVDAFKDNFASILDIAKSKGEAVLLMTFASYVPDGYTGERFKGRALDYTLHLLPIEFWGAQENVVAGISAHNAVIRELAHKYDNVMLVDQDGLIPKRGEYFNDICHLTHKGSEKFADNVFEVVRGKLTLKREPNGSRRVPGRYGSPLLGS